jgi:DNA ligase-1
MTEKYPDLVALIPHVRGQGTESFILEGEVVAVDDQGSVKTFQALAGRGKKNVGLSEVKVQVCLYAFDLMYLNGEVCNPYNHFLTIEFTR